MSALEKKNWAAKSLTDKLAYRVNEYIRKHKTCVITKEVDGVTTTMTVSLTKRHNREEWARTFERAIELLPLGKTVFETVITEDVKAELMGILEAELQDKPFATRLGELAFFAEL